jgi:hypothetical protein
MPSLRRISVRSDGMVAGSTVGLCTRLGDGVIIRSEIRELSVLPDHDEQALANDRS